MSVDPYLYPGTSALRNRAGIRDPDLLDRYERNKVTERATEGVPSGDFDLKHLQAIHRHLFQDIYDWAGETRTVEISKGGSGFLPSNRIVMGMNDVHRRIRQQNYLNGSTPEKFAKSASELIGDINHVHPFREGNGRTQLQYLKQLAVRAGHDIKLDRLNGPKWIEASIAANRGNYTPMEEAIRGALISHEREKPTDRSGDKRSERIRQSLDRERGGRGR